MKVYLAGPDVFSPNAVALGLNMVELCARKGIEGLFPLDNVLSMLPGESKPAFARRIAQANEEMIWQADAVVANMEPFRGPGMDGGTAYEIGYARGLGRAVIGYLPEKSLSGATLHPTTYLERVLGTAAVVGGSADHRDDNGLLVEDFELVDNLMMATGISSLHIGLSDALDAAVSIVNTFREGPLR